ncbi:MAG: response regulator [Leptolyngbyaceae cyanobacterium CAN_BIN12]|nr:response regulator [Leptolyngbyaceae cyanobacterium CAN_BIN12]
MHRSREFSTNFSFFQGLRVLIVDNHIDSSDLIALILQSYGVGVQTALLVQPALKIFRQWQPDILVSEIALPDEDGLALIRQVRMLGGESNKRVTAIAVTAYVTEKMHQCALSSGFYLWFTKPLDFDAFVAEVAYLAICRQSPIAILSDRGDANAPMSICQFFQPILNSTSGLDLF